MPVARCTKIPVVSIFLLICSLQSLAQSNPNLETGFKPFSSHWNERFDSIDNVTGALTVDIPLVSYPQRGGQLGLQFGLHFRNPSFYTITTCSPCFTQWDSTGGGFQLVDRDDLQVQESNLLNVYLTPYLDYAVYSPDGSTHPLGNTNGTQYRSTDTTGLLFDVSTSLLTDSRGIRYQQYKRPAGCFEADLNFASYKAMCDATLREDPNGNQISFSNLSGWTDTLGRLIPVPLATQDFSGCTGTQYHAITSANLWNLPGPNGSTNQIKFCYATINVDYPSKSSFLGYHGTPSMLQSVVLPDGTAWTFQYSADGFGQLAAMTLPTGATISYGYSSDQSCNYGGSSVSGHQRVATRTVNANDGTAAASWNYSYVFAQSPSASTQTTITDPLGNTQVRLASGFGGGCTLYETQVSWYQGPPSTGKLLRTEGKSYSYSTTPYTVVYLGAPSMLGNVFLTQLDTTMDGKKKTITYVPDALFTYRAADPSNTAVYSALYGKTTQVLEYDFGTNITGSLLRKTVTTYSWQTSTNYLFYNLLNLPSSVTAYDVAGILAAKTSYVYDGSALAVSGITTQHNASPANGSFRGNLTSIQMWLNSGTLTCPDGSSGGAASNVISTATYFDTGTVNTSADPCHNARTYSYSANVAGAYPTHVTNALNQPTDYTYDFNTGLLTSRQDENRLSTSYSYDSLWRIARVNYPDGGVDVFTRHDSPPFTATLTKMMNSSQNVVTTNVFDALDRLSQIQGVSDPQGTVFVDTQYDPRGQIASVSNPHRSGLDPTGSPGTTSYIYDGLGRKTRETAADGAVTTTAYCGSSTLVTDPDGKWRRSRIDGLGRLVEVDEPNAVGATVAPSGCPGAGEPVWVTSYTYDALGNLKTSVQNGSRQRTFTYDSLSRLLTANNPETGTIAYTYNAHGPLLTKTDARGITTTYSYDRLGRETLRTYSNGDPTVTTRYDEAGCLGLATCSNVGRRTSVTDAAGSEAWSFQVDPTNLRSIQVNQRTTNSGATAITKTSTYNLDLAGNITSMVYPTGRVVNYSYDSANRPGKATDASNGITYASDAKTPPTGCLANTTCYTPQGAFYTLSIGQTAAFNGLDLTHTYNNRLQPIEFKAASPAGTLIDITYSFVNPATTKNPGHVFQITNNLNAGRTQVFTYDQVNRIISAGTATQTGQYCWGYNYTYDAWGNLLSQTGGAAYTACMQTLMAGVTADTANHISGLTYDSSGNTLNDGLNTHTWNAESELKSSAGVNYAYDGSGRRVYKSSGKLYWYGAGNEILAETNGSGTPTAEYVYFGGLRVAMIPAGGNPIYYVADLLGSSRVLVQSNGTLCYDGDFTPYGGERSYISTCPQDYKFEGKERDTESGNDDFGARYYLWRVGRWLSADWSAVPVPVPYANLTNPQTLNLYSMVADDPETFADLDGHWQEGPHVGSTMRGQGLELTDEARQGEPPPQPKPAPQEQKPDQKPEPPKQPDPNKPPSWDPKKPLPDDPQKLGPDWKRDPNHKAPNDERYKNPNGDKLDWHKGKPGEKGWQGKDHWHWNEHDWHFKPGDTVKSVATAITVGVIVYWVVSEGSRAVFPPRNLVPVL
jgi:RHS repeat-associated protein